MSNNSSPIETLLNPFSIFIDGVNFVRNNSLIMSTIMSNPQQKLPKAIAMYSSDCNRLFEPKDNLERFQCQNCSKFEKTGKGACQIIDNRGCPDKGFIKEDAFCILFSEKPEPIQQ